METIAFIRKHIYFLFLFTFVVLAGCNKQNNLSQSTQPQGIKVLTLSDNNYSIELYTANGKLQTGYNEITLWVKDKNGKVVIPDSITWNPMMHMMNMSHSCPASAISLQSSATGIYAGYIVFQMASDSMNYWQLAIVLKKQNMIDTLTGVVKVLPSPLQVVQTFRGADSNKYVVAYAGPANPKIGINTMSAVLYQMISMSDFIPVHHYKILIDPRMPDMGNHGSPNNTPFVEGTDGLYRGQLNLTMSGFWRINLQVLDSAGNILAGQPINEQNTSSSLYFEIQF
ncbi:MAG: FixH family protein [Thermoflavifilum sp.]|nr:FixH family protein [Thermoflavifilum sp.]